MKTVNIIVPVFNEEEGLKDFYREICRIIDGLSGYRTSIIFIDDGSSDSSLTIIKHMAEENSRVQYISFSRNFGKEAAIYAGLQHADADYTVLMDADLQHPPCLIPEMIDAVSSGKWDACGAKRIPGFMSRMFNKLNNKMSDVKLETGATDYMCMNRKFVDAVLKLSENQRFSKGLFAWVGFDVKWIDYTQGPRTAGKSKWNFRKLFSYAIDGIAGFSVIPLKLVTWAGAIICFLAAVYIIITLIETLINGIDVPGYVTLLVSILFMGGLLMLAIGVLGSYIGRIYIESKDRPIYIMDETNMENKNEQPESNKE